MKDAVFNVLIGALLMFGLGTSFAGGFYYGRYESRVLGFFHPNMTCSDANELKDYYDPYAPWICINVKKMDFDQALNTCNHEVAHYIFDQSCKDNLTRCMPYLNKKVLSEAFAELCEKNISSCMEAGHGK